MWNVGCGQGSYGLQTPHCDYEDDDNIETGTSEVFVEKQNTDYTGARTLSLSRQSAADSYTKVSLHTGLPFLSAVQGPYTGDVSSTTALHGVDTKVQKLIAAVSADIINSALSLRSEYLLASGMSEEAVALELEALSKPPSEQ